MPLLFSLAIHNALKDVQGHLENDELLFAFLDDVYVVCLSHRVRSIFNLLDDRLSRLLGIRLYEGKTRVWNKAGECPEETAELGPEVWSPEGVKIFGSGDLGQGGGCGTRCLGSCAVRMASVGAVRRTQMSPPLAHIVTIPNRRACRRS